MKERRRKRTSRCGRKSNRTIGGADEGWERNITRERVGVGEENKRTIGRANEGWERNITREEEGWRGEGMK